MRERGTSPLSSSPSPFRQFQQGQVPEGATLRQQRPRHARHRVGERDRHDLERASRQELREEGSSPGRSRARRNTEIAPTRESGDGNSGRDILPLVTTKIESEPSNADAPVRSSGTTAPDQARRDNPDALLLEPARRAALAAGAAASRSPRLCRRCKRARAPPRRCGGREDDLSKDEHRSSFFGYRNPPRLALSQGPERQPQGTSRPRRCPMRPCSGRSDRSENGRERRVTAEEAFLLHLIKHGLDGDTAPRGTSILSDAHTASMISVPPSVCTGCSFVSPGSVNLAVEPLRIGTTLDRHRETTARLVLEPWIVEAALARFGEKRLPPRQEIVLKATRTPAKVRWPDWWVAKPRD